MRWGEMQECYKGTGCDNSPPPPILHITPPLRGKKKTKNSNPARNLSSNQTNSAQRAFWTWGLFKRILCLLVVVLCVFRTSGWMLFWNDAPNFVCFFSGFSVNVVHEQQHVDATLLRSYTVVWFFFFFNTHCIFVSIMNFFIQLLGESKWKLLHILLFPVWNHLNICLKAVIHVAFCLVAIEYLREIKPYLSLLCFFYDPNTIVYCSLLFCLFMYQTLWGHPSFRLSHDQLDTPLQSQRVLIFRRRLISETKW